MKERLYRSKEDRMIAGVCGGLAEYFNMDPTIVRLLWIAAGFTFGCGVIAYLIAVLIIPLKPDETPS